MAYHLGVDLGTTFTAAAVIQAGRAEVFQLGDHRPQVPSAVFRTRTDDYLVGDAAIRAGTTDPSRLAAEFKRRMGDDVSILLGGAPMPPHLLMSVLLRWVVAAVTAGQGGPPESVVVTHPANWGEYRRELLAQAAAEADLVRVRFCTEPEAAAMHFASVNRVSPGAYVAVYDLGGGTFDAAVLRHEQDGSFGMVGTPQGIEHLGGIDFDEALLDHVRNTVDLSGADVSDRNVLLDLARLRRECTEAKEYLSAASDTELSVSVGATRALIRLTRADLESSVRPALLQTVATLARTVKQAGLEVDELEAVVLVGGSSRIPLVTELLVQELGRPVRLSPHPKHCVALGAALLASGSSSSTMTEGPAVQPPMTDRVAVVPASGARTPTEPIPVVTVEPSLQPGPPPRTPDRRRAAIVGAMVATVLVAGGAIVVATNRSDPSPGAPGQVVAATGTAAHRSTTSTEPSSSAAPASSSTSLPGRQRETSQRAIPPSSKSLKTPASSDTPTTRPVVACTRTLSNYPVVSPGEKGKAVVALQCFLNDAGLGRVTVDGWYGPETTSAVSRLESRLGLAGSGRVNNRLWVALISQPLGKPLKTGSSGSAVTSLQRALRAAGGSVAVDGNFGSQTEGVVKAFQTANGIPVDGTVGSDTYSVLKSGGLFGSPS